MSYGKQVDTYIIEDELGRGAFGSVHKCRNMVDNTIHAIKVIRVDSLQNSEGIVGQLLKDEIQVLSKVDSPNVLKLEHYYQTSQNCYIIMEYCDSGDLERYWEQNGRMLQEDKVIDIITQVLNGLRALHENNVIHRDLKLPNILMHKDQVKLADLGFCAQLQHKDMQVSLCLGSYGTMAPEVAKFEFYGLQSDIFSIGCIFYQLLFGELPFDFATSEQYLESIAAQKINFKRNNVKVSTQVQEIISKMLIENPNQRLTFTQLYQYNLFRNAKPNNQASLIALKNITNDQSRMFYTTYYQQNGGLQKLGPEMVDMLRTQHLFNTRMQQTQEHSAPIPQENRLEDTRNIGSAQIQNVADLYNFMRQSNNLPIFATINPILETEQLPSMAAVQQKVKQYEAKYNALMFLQQVHDEIGNIKFSQIERIYFPQFMMLKKIRYQAQEYFDEIQHKHKQINELIKMKEKFKQISQDQQISICLENITFNQSPQMGIQLEWMGQLSLNLDSIHELNHIYEASLKEFHTFMKQEANTIKEKKQLFIVILKVEQCMKYTVMELQNKDFTAYFDELRKKNILDLLKMISQ